jgi:hypothetical protein
MREVEPILRVQADHVGIVLTFEVPRSCWVYADPRRLKQILLNLGSNGNQTHRGRRLGLGAGRAKRRQLRSPLPTPEMLLGELKPVRLDCAHIQEIVDHRLSIWGSRPCSPAFLQTSFDEMG